MGFITAILAFFKALPEIISIVQEVMKLLKQAGTAIEQKQTAKQLAAGIVAARDTKDTSLLEGVFRIVSSTPMPVRLGISLVPTLASDPGIPSSPVVAPVKSLELDLAKKKA